MKIEFIVTEKKWQKGKKKMVLDSMAFCKKHIRQAGFFFVFVFPKNKCGNSFFYPFKFDLKFKYKQKWKVCVICVLPGLRLLGHAAGTSLGFMPG